METVFTQNEIKEASKTSRPKSFSKKAIVPKKVLEIASPMESILDFGAGKDAVHTQILREKGLNVTAYDFKVNSNTMYHRQDALKYKYDIVMVSNVLNIQISKGMLEDTLSQIKNCVKEDGFVIANYPKEPRKLDINILQLRTILLDYFQVVEDIANKKSYTIFKLSKPIK
jgi:hypothetical protein